MPSRSEQPPVTEARCTTASMLRSSSRARSSKEPNSPWTHGSPSSGSLRLMQTTSRPWAMEAASALPMKPLAPVISTALTGAAPPSSR